MAGGYDTFIKLVAVDSFSPVVGIIGKELLKLEGGVKAIGTAWKAVGAGLAVFGGVEALKVAGGLLNHGNELVRVQNKIAEATSNTAIAQEAVRLSWQATAKHMNVSVVEAANLADHMREIFGSQADANKFIEPGVEFMSFLKAWDAGHKGTRIGDNPEMEYRSAIKIAEQERGGATPENVKRVTDEVLKAKIASGGNVSAAVLLAARNLAGPAWNLLDEDFKYGVLPALIQTQKQSVGKQLIQGFQKMTAEQMWSKTALGAGIQAGEIDPSKVEYDKVGRPMRLLPGGVVHAKEFAADPLKWFEGRMIPYLDKTFGDDMAKRAGFLGRLGGNQNLIRLFNEFDQQYHKLEKDRQLPGQVKGDWKGFTDNSWDAAVQGFQMQWKNLMTALGAPSVGTATGMLRKIDEALASITQAVAAHPGLAKALVSFGAALAAVAVVAGSITLLTLALGGLGLAPFIAIAAGVAAVGLAFDAFKRGVAALPASISAAITAAMDAIAALFRNAISRITGSVGGAQSGAAGPGTPFNHQLSPAPAVPPPAAPGPVTINNQINIDGKKLASNTMSHAVAAATFPRDGVADSRSQWMGPSWEPAMQG